MDHSYIAKSSLWKMTVIGKLCRPRVRVYFTHLSKLLEVPLVQRDATILLILPSRYEVQRGGVVNGREVLVVEALTAVQQRRPEILLLPNLLAVAPQLRFWSPTRSRRGGDVDGIIDIITVLRGQSGRQFVPGISSGRELNLVAWKRKPRRNWRYRGRKVEFGVGASQAIYGGIVSTGGLLCRFVGTQPYLRSGFGHPDFGPPTPPFSHSDSLKFGAFFTAFVTWKSIRMMLLTGYCHILAKPKNCGTN